MVAVVAGMSCQDRQHYGPLGKSGNSHLVVCPQIFLGTNNSGGPEDSLRPGMLVSAFVRMASGILASKAANGLPTNLVISNPRDRAG